MRIGLCRTGGTSLCVVTAVTAFSASHGDHVCMNVRDAASRARQPQRKILTSLLFGALVAPLVPAQSPCYPSPAASASCCGTACSVAAARTSSSVDCCTTVMRGEQRPSFVPASGEDAIRAALAMDQVGAFASPVAARSECLAGGNRPGQPPPHLLNLLLQTCLLLI